MKSAGHWVVLVVGIGLGVVGSQFLSGPTSTLQARPNDRYEDYVMCTGACAVGPAARRPTASGCSTTAPASCSARSSTATQGKIVGWAEVDLVSEFELPPQAERPLPDDDRHITAGPGGPVRRRDPTGQVRRLHDWARTRTARRAWASAGTTCSSFRKSRRLIERLFRSPLHRGSVTVNRGMIDAHIHVVPPRLPGVGPLQPAAERAARKRRRRAARSRCRPPASRTPWRWARWRGGDDDPLGVAGTLRIAGPRPRPARHRRGRPDPDRRRPPPPRRGGPGDRPRPGAQGLPRLPALRPRAPELPPVLRAGRALPAAGHLPHRRHLLAATPSSGSPTRCWSTTWRSITPTCASCWPTSATRGLIDAAEVVYKNMNVWADLSGLVVGDAAAFAAEERQDMLADLRRTVQRGVPLRRAAEPLPLRHRLAARPDGGLPRLRAGRLIPEVYHEQVFERERADLFGIQG